MKTIHVASILAVMSMTPTASYSQATERVEDIGQFTFERGGELAAMKVGYATWGRLAPGGENVVLLLPPTSGTRHSYDALIGPGKAIDTGRWFVIAIDPIGGGTSSKPADGAGMAFPSYSIRDMVAAQYRQVLNTLHIQRLRAIVGASMGSFQASEWGISHPLVTDQLILIARAARSGEHFGNIVDAMVLTLKSTPHLGNPTFRQTWSPTLHAAAAQFMPWSRSDAYLTRLGKEGYRREAAALGDQGAAASDPVSLIWRYEASAGHNVDLPFGGNVQAALHRVQAQTLVIRITSDRTVPDYLTTELLAGLPHATEVTLSTVAGHGAFGAAPGTLKYDQMSKAIADRLALMDHGR